MRSAVVTMFGLGLSVLTVAPEALSQPGGGLAARVSELEAAGFASHPDTHAP